MRIAIISDIHGNQLALEAVLRDLEDQPLIRDGQWNLYGLHGERLLTYQYTWQQSNCAPPGFLRDPDSGVTVQLMSYEGAERLVGGMLTLNLLSCDRLARVSADRCSAARRDLRAGA